MTQQLTDNEAAVVTNATDSDDDDTADFMPNNFKWTTKQEKSLLFNMIRLKPSGINKHLNMLIIRELVSKELNLNISTKSIWKYLDKKWNIEESDLIERSHFNTIEKDFALSEDFEQLIAEETEKFKKVQEKESLNNENNKKKIFSNLRKTRSKSNSMSSVDSKDGLHETIPSVLSDNCFVKTNDTGSEEAPRRSLRTNEKPEEKELENEPTNKKKLLRGNNKSDELNKSMKVLHKKTPTQSKDLDKIEITLSNIGGRKRKIRNISESSFSSDNSKQTRSHKNNVTDINISDSSSRSVTPEILRNKTSNRSITPETISRKSNLRSGDKLVIEKACLKYGHSVELILPEIKIERFKPEKNDKKNTSLDIKSKHPLQNKNEAHSKLKGKIRGSRVTSDLLVALQVPELPTSRRSCNNKS